MSKEFVVSMSSEEYGYEEFVYDTEPEMKAGLERLQKKCESLNDGVARTFRTFDRLFCDECGAPMEIEENGVSSHLDSDGKTDYEANSDHVAFSSSESDLF